MIDWTTTKVVAAIGYGRSMGLIRWGNLVWAKSAGSWNSVPGANAWKGVSETIPSGYRPKENTWIKDTQNSPNLGVTFWKFNTDGSIQLFVRGTHNTSDTLWFSTMWFTDDPMP